MEKNFYDFIGGDWGKWKVLNTYQIKGEGLPSPSHLNIVPSDFEKEQSGIWRLRGFTSNVRYANRTELNVLSSIQAPLGREDSNFAALIPIKKSETWWQLSQDERRHIFEESSHHTEIGIKFLPQIARKLFHCRDIGEPYDFLTWFEFSSENRKDFDLLLESLRASEEWEYVESEMEIRLERIEF
ncbi:chlorite dismutase [Leptospira ryugenii]|uniref:Chlorite dismutase n=1 Tax=Leptospira ryugenii TaxID=1917863 RepID=A0A2P2DXF9_9LEPT|nr:chlorite dismutase family protein [Leptospira ryugenii]GBF49313.1 chlorite dismutase [Leptospira ryugenii]